VMDGRYAPKRWVLGGTIARCPLASGSEQVLFEDPYSELSTER
jgi:hypothetical protein